MSPTEQAAASNTTASLLDAFVHVDGDRMVMRANVAPYVVTPLRRIDFSAYPTTRDAMNRMIETLCPPAVLRALDDIGCVKYELPQRSDEPGQHFTLFVSRSDEDVQMEIRRQRTHEDDALPSDLFRGPRRAR